MNTTMNEYVKMILAGMAIAVLSSSAYARGDDCEYGPGHGGYGMHGGGMGANPERWEKMREEHQAALHDRLKLTAQQEPAWKKYISQPPLMDKTNRMNPEELDKLTSPQRLEKVLEHMRAAEARMADHLAALKEFYTMLTPEQQKIFDEYAGPRHWRGEKKGK